MQLLYLTKQLFGGKSVNQKPGLFALARVAGRRRGLRIDGARSSEVALPILQKLLRKQGAAVTHASPPRLDQRGSVGLPLRHLRLRDANVVLELLGEKVIQPVGCNGTQA